MTDTKLFNDIIFYEDLNDATYFFLHKSTRMVLALESVPGKLVYIKKLILKRHALRNVKLRTIGELIKDTTPNIILP